MTAVALAQNSRNKMQAYVVIQTTEVKDDNQYFYIVYDFAEQQVKSIIRLAIPETMTGITSL